MKADAEGKGPTWKANRGEVRVAPETVLLVLVCSYWKGLLLFGYIPFFNVFSWNEIISLTPSFIQRLPGTVSNPLLCFPSI